jgi:crossover junction endonuclease EME1
MSDFILISDGEDEATPPPSKRARKNRTPTDLNLDTEPSLQKQPPGSASTPFFLDETPLSDDVTVLKSSFGSGTGASSGRENNFFGKRVISLESDSEDSPGPESSKKYEPVYTDSWKKPCRLEFGSSDANSGEANYDLLKYIRHDEIRFQRVVSSPLINCSSFFSFR